MVFTKRFMDTNWRGNKPVKRYQQWYQSLCSDPWRSQLYKDTPYIPNRHYLQRGKYQTTQTWPRHKKYISPEGKQLLKKKMEEVVSYNSSKPKPYVINTNKEIGEPSSLPKKERRARCFICRKRGHFFWKCKEKEEKGNIQETETNTMDTTPIETPQDEAVFKYKPETVHVSTDYMVQGSDLGSWDEIWYVSTAYKRHMTPMKQLFKRLMQRFQVEGTEERQKKFIVSYGVGEVIVNTDRGRLMVPNVVYTPEITLNILSLEQLKEQGYFVSHDGNRCKIWYMFDHMYDETVDKHNIVVGESDGSMTKRHNEFLDEYFKSIDPDDACSLVKGMEELKMEKDIDHDYVDSEYISMNGTLYFLKVNTFQRFIAFLDLIAIDKFVYGNWEVLKGKFMEMIEWFYKEYLGQEVLGELPPTVGVIKIDLLALYKFVDALGGYMNVSFNGNWHQLTKILGLAYEHQETVKEIYEYIGLVKLYYVEAKRVQGEPEGLASISEMEPQNDARVIAHGAQGNAQVEALEAQEQEISEESPRKKYKRMKDVMQSSEETKGSKFEESTSSSDDFIIIT